MIPRLHQLSPTQARYLDFVQALPQQGFQGDVLADYAQRTVFATDNSLYQVLPQAVVHPRSTADVALLCRQAWEAGDIVLSPRGGGTGTNGQSLTDGIVVDLSRYLTGIIAIDPLARTARVQAGVVKDRLNAALQAHGLFFAPDTSTSNRATIGGMLATDACGQGSCVYGKTHHHVLATTSVLMDGSVWDATPLSPEALATVQQRPDRIGTIHRLLADIHRERGAEIQARFPVLNRNLTGYDLANIYDPDGRFNLNNLLCGAEGTLAMVTEITVNLEPIRRHSALVNLRYDSFDASLRDARALMSATPLAIETVDDTVLGLAQNDVIWQQVGEFFPDDGSAARGINLVEFAADDPTELEAQVDTLTQRLVAGESTAQGYTIARGEQVKQVWAMRKRAVGLLGNVQGEARPVPFVEDCAVPPEQLADFIAEFRALLDAEGLEYGMFGHVDAGVLHVRPALDLKDPALLSRVRTVTDKVVALTQRYHGLLWGEHGKGIRSEYVPAYFGPLYPCLQAIKAAFDPANQLNPGKIATPSASEAHLLAIDTVPTRGEHDRQISPPVRQHYQHAMYCNGNGACFDYDPGSAMCPSYKATGERRHSPKGRATLIKEWLRLLAEQGVDPVAEERQAGSIIQRLRNGWAARRGAYDFSHEVHAAMAGCLGCKACAGQCPIRVNVPSFRSTFLALYHGRYPRPLRDYLVASLEFIVPVAAQVRPLYNGLLGLAPITALLARLGLVDSPAIHGRPALPLATPALLDSLSPAETARTVVIVQDAFTSYFETPLVAHTFQLLQRLGYHPLLAPFRANGKPLHVHGFLAAFRRTARRQATLLNAIAARGIPLLGIDPSMTLTYRDEYRELLGDQAPTVQLLAEWLANQGEQLRSHAPATTASFRLLPHCTERSNAPAAVTAWQTVFGYLHQELAVVAAGCCGMAGTYGHETAHRDTSRQLYELSWATTVATADERLLVSGYSCRSQVKRFAERQLHHPVTALLALLDEADGSVSTK